MFDELPSGLRKTVTVCCIATIVVAAVITLLAPVAFITSNTRDALFLTDVGWRMYHGAVPGVDFQHFYGGLTEQVIGWAMRIFGPSMKVLDQGIVMIWAGLAAATAAMSLHRLSWPGFLFLLSIVSATILSKAALNDSVALASPIATYGTLYNRFGVAVALVVMAFCLVPARNPKAEGTGATVAGLGLVLLTIIKPTFAVLVPAALLALALQARWASLGLMILAGIVFSFLADPWAARFLGSIGYIQAIGGDTVSPLALVAKGVQLLLVQPFALTAALLAFAISAWQPEEKLWRWPLAAVVLMAALTAMASTMSKEMAIGQQMVPFLAAFTVFVAGRLWQSDALVKTATFTLMTVSTVAFAVPMLFNTIVAGAMAVSHRNEGLFPPGPMAPFVGVSYTVPLVDPKTARPYPLAVLTEKVANAIAKGRAVDSGMGAVMMADGVNALSQIQGANQTGIVSETYTFSFAAGAPPVLDFPTYQRPSAPELAPDTPFSDAIGIVMLLRDPPEKSTETQTSMITKMADRFQLCLQTDIWLIYTRDDNAGCTERASPDAQ